MDSLLAGCDGFNQLLVYPRRIQVHQSDPLDAGDFLKLSDKTRQSVLGLQIAPVVCRVLGDQVQLENAGTSQLGRLSEHELGGLAPERASYPRDCAVRAPAIAALADAQVGPMSRCNEKPCSVVGDSVKVRLGRHRARRRTGDVSGQDIADYLGDVVTLVETYDGINSGNFLK